MNLGARTAAWSGYSARDYVQDGLIFQLDGIENVAYGSHSKTTTKWYDLKGNYGPYTLASGMSVTDNAIKNSGAIGSYIDTGTRFGNLNSYSIEVVFTRTATAGKYPSIFSAIESGGAGFQSVEGGNTAFVVGNPAGGYFITDYFTYTAGVVQSQSGVADPTNGKVKGCLNGQVKSVVSSYSTTRWNSSYAFFICADPGDTGQNSFCGYIHSIRFYNRALTATEIANNYAVDKARFGLT